MARSRSAAPAKALPHSGVGCRPLSAGSLPRAGSDALRPRRRRRLPWPSSGTARTPKHARSKRSAALKRSASTSAPPLFERAVVGVLLPLLLLPLAPSEPPAAARKCIAAVQLWRAAATTTPRGCPTRPTGAADVGAGAAGKLASRQLAIADGAPGNASATQSAQSSDARACGCRDSGGMAYKNGDCLGCGGCHRYSYESC